MCCMRTTRTSGSAGSPLNCRAVLRMRDSCGYLGHGCLRCGLIWMGKAAALCGDILRGLRERPQQPMAKKKAGDIPLKLTEAEQDLLWHMEHGYQLETDSLSG